MEFSFNSDKLEASRSGDYSFRQTEKDGSYLYHVSYSEETGGSYSVIRTPYKFFLQSRIHATFWIFISGLILISLNIAIFGGITQSINRPLTRLVNMCEEIGKGNFNVRIPCSPKDELSYLTTSLNAMTDQVQQLIEEVYVKNLTKRNLELQMLRSQINPHFLYNTLENMRMSAYTQGYQELSEMCLLLSKVLRYGVTNQSDLVTVREELAHLQDYTTLLKYCFPTLQVTICVDEGIMDYYMTKVLFQPLVENSVNHAASNLQQPLQIQIWGYGDGNDMVFVISDNGSGITKEQLTAIRISLEDETDTQHGIGLKNIHRRIRLYYGENYGLLINSSPGRGTSVTVRIPRQNK